MLMAFPDVTQNKVSLRNHHTLPLSVRLLQISNGWSQTTVPSGIPWLPSVSKWILAQTAHFDGLYLPYEFGWQIHRSD